MGLGQSPDRRHLLSQGRLQQEVPESVCRATKLRSLGYKLVRRIRRQHELYDLQEDPGELRNPIDEPGMQDIRADLERAMLDWFMRTSDTVPVGGDPRKFPAVSIGARPS